MHVVDTKNVKEKNTRRETTYHAEEGGHAHGAEEQDNTEEEPLDKRPLQTSHKVQTDREEQDLDNDQGNVNADLRDGKRGRTVHGKSLVLVQDRTTLHGHRQLGLGNQSVEEQRKKQNTSTSEGTVDVHGQQEEDTSDNNGLDDVRDITRDHRGHVTPGELELADGEGLDLADKVDGVGVLDRDVLLLLLLGGVLELGSGVLVLDLFLVGNALMLDVGVEGRGLEGNLKLLGRARNATFESRAGSALVGIGDGGQVIGGCLTSGALESEIDKVLTGLVGRSKVDTATLVEKDGLVKEVVDVLGLTMH